MLEEQKTESMDGMQSDKLEEMKRMVVEQQTKAEGDALRGKGNHIFHEEIGGHSHHSSSHSSRRYKKKHRSKWSKIKKSIKSNKKKAVIWIISALIFISFFAGILFWGFSQYRPSIQKGTLISNEEKETMDSTIVIESSFFSNKPAIVDKPILEYMESDITVSASEIYDRYKESGRMDIGLPVNLVCNVRGVPDGINVEGIQVYLSEDERFASPLVYTADESRNMVSIPYLKASTKYYYRIVVLLSNGTEVSTQSHFETEDTPRIISLEGIANVRDIGGWKVRDGRRVRQGILYRGTELDGLMEPSFVITAEGAQDMLTNLRVRTEIDLRVIENKQYVKDVFGTGVKHISCSASAYADVFSNESASSMKRVFSELADENNYPTYLHCTYGRDRTGTICYLLEALLGVSDEDLMRDYQLSAMYYGEVPLEEMTKFINQLQTYAGSATQEKVENYLLSIGVTPSEIQSIRDIFLEE